MSWHNYKKGHQRARIGHSFYVNVYEKQNDPGFWHWDISLREDKEQRGWTEEDSVIVTGPIPFEKKEEARSAALHFLDREFRKGLGDLEELG